MANRRKHQRDALRAEMAATREHREPVRIPTRWLKTVIALFLLPLAGVWTQTFFRCFSRATIAHEFWKEDEFRFFALGAALWLVTFFGLPRPVLLYVFGHELTHAVWVWLMGGRVNAFKIRSEGGHIITDTTNFWITLSPYFYPIYSIALLAIYFVASLFTDVAPYHRWFFALLGATWCFHITFTLWVIPKGQTDLTTHGTFFSLVIIYLMNLLVLSLLLILGAGDVGFGDFANEFRDNGEAFLQWAGAWLR